MGHSQSANVIVDVENGHDTGALLLQAAGDVKQNHICSNAMQISGGGGGNANSNNGGGGVGVTGGSCQGKVPLGNDMYGTKNNRGCSNNGVQGQQEHHMVTTIPIKNQPQQQQQQYGRNNANQSYNAVGMMTLPKVGIGGNIMQQQQHLGTMGYSNRNDCATLPRNINTGNVGNHIGKLLLSTNM